MKTDGIETDRRVTSLQRSNARSVVTLLAVLAIALALYQLQRADDGLTIVTARVDSTPVTIYRPQSALTAPAVVIAHGFAGSQQLMRPFALTLARNGYVAVTFDFLGHGRNPQPMRGDITKEKGITDALIRELGAVADFAQALPQSDGRLAVLGHSMASDIVVKYAAANRDVQATVAVSAFSRAPTATVPRNLLVIVGALEPNTLRDEGLRIVGLATEGTVAPGTTYGEFDNGSARRLALAGGVEHIGVLYSRDSLTEALNWIDASFDRRTGNFIDAPGGWLALLFGGILALAWPLSRWLPVIRLRSRRAGLGWGAVALAAVTPALLTPLLLWKIPTDFLPILLGDYLTLHFLVYGAMTAALLWWMRSKAPAHAHPRPTDTPQMIARHGAMTHRLRQRIALGALAVAGFNIVAFGLPIDAYLFSFMPIPQRWPIILAIACGAVPFFVADEMLSATANRFGVYALTKFCFLISLALAILLNPPKLFFLAVIVPAILILFVVFGVVSRLSLRATGHPLPGALGNAALFAWGIACTFPMEAR